MEQIALRITFGQQMRTLVVQTLSKRSFCSARDVSLDASARFATSDRPLAVQVFGTALLILRTLVRRAFFTASVAGALEFRIGSVPPDHDREI